MTIRYEIKCSDMEKLLFPNTLKNKAAQYIWLCILADPKLTRNRMLRLFSRIWSRHGMRLFLFYKIGIKLLIFYRNSNFYFRKKGIHPRYIRYLLGIKLYYFFHNFKTHKLLSFKFCSSSLREL